MVKSQVSLDRLILVTALVTLLAACNQRRDGTVTTTEAAPVAHEPQERASATPAEADAPSEPAPAVAAAPVKNDVPRRQRYTRQIGPDSPKIRADQGRLYLWADGDIDRGDVQWFDVTNSPLVAGQFQYGIGKDYISPIDNPLLVGGSDSRLKQAGVNGNSEVLAFVYAHQARAYPLAVLQTHEVINDFIAGEPVVVAFSPLERDWMLFSRRIDQETVQFGHSGYSYNNKSVLYDRATQSLWLPDNAGGVIAIAGPYAGRSLPTLAPAELTHWGEWFARRPNTLVLLPVD